MTLEPGSNFEVPVTVLSKLERVRNSPLKKVKRVRFSSAVLIILQDRAGQRDFIIGFQEYEILVYFRMVHVEST